LKILAQRVLSSSVVVNKKEIASINEGILALVGFEKEDKTSTCKSMVKKLVNYRLFSDNEGKIEKSVIDIRGSILLVPQVTLALDTKKGTRPSFSQAASPELGNQLFGELILEFKKNENIYLENGLFGANMEISLVNQGPVTFYFEL
tara:strand:+ start:405 stop:845 length:441 start_codon:yes stop_codon:yes gene_type:complete